jgi:hypothetical protein
MEDETVVILRGRTDAKMIILILYELHFDLFKKYFI